MTHSTYKGMRTLIDNFRYNDRSPFQSIQQVIQDTLETYSNVRNSQLALFVSLPATTLLVSLVCISGLVIYATYHDCDPLLAGELISRDQLLPYFVLEKLGNFKGVPGIFVSCIFAAALSSISSCLNALSITILEDLVKPTMGPAKMNPKLEAFLAKALGVLSGLVIIALAFICYYIGNTVLQIMLTALGAGGGPLLGLFLLGMFFPCVNAYGAIASLVVSTFATFWIATGAIVKQVPQPTLPFSTQGCQAGKNATEIFNDLVQLQEAAPLMASPTEMPIFPDVTGFDVIYKLSFLWYPTLAVFVSLVVGVIVSAFTGWTAKSSIDSRFVYPVHKRLCCCLPRRLRKWINCASMWTENVSFVKRGGDGGGYYYHDDDDSDDDDEGDNDSLDVNDLSKGERTSLLVHDGGNKNSEEEHGNSSDGFETEMDSKL